MGQPKDGAADAGNRSAACERTGSAAVLEGSIASLGSQYVLGLRAKNCPTGRILDQEQTVAAKGEDVLNSLSQISGQFRTRVGESQAMVAKHSLPLAEASTPSLEALKAYSTGMKTAVSSGHEAAIPSLRQHAIEIDPKFAMAYAQLGVSYSLLESPLLSAQSTTKAWQSRDRVSDREGFFIDFTHDWQVTGGIWKRRTKPSSCGIRLILEGRHLNVGVSWGAFRTMGRAVMKERWKMAQKTNRMTQSRRGVRVLRSCVGSYFSWTISPKLKPRFSVRPARKLETPDVLILRYNIELLRGDQKADGPHSETGERKAAGRNTG